MVKSFKNNSAFTLVEVLIVVVIIGILAALIVPRILQQTENAYLAEAHQMIGVLRRAQHNYMTLTGSTATGVGFYCINQTSGICSGAVDPNFPKLGLAPFATTNFAYACEPAIAGASGYCYAIRISGPYKGARMNLYFASGTSEADGEFSCENCRGAGGPCVSWTDCNATYVYRDSADHTKGCKLGTPN